MGEAQGASAALSATVGDLDERSWESERWREFYRGVARRIVTTLQPASVHDLGCRRGLLVQALAELGVDATGSDNSSQAIESAHPDVRGRLRVANAVDPLPGRYDLITCVGVLERLPAVEAQKAVDAIVAATDRVLISSTPSDFETGEHVTVQPVAPWASAFAERGFFLRGSDLDGVFLTSWALMLERGDPAPASIVREYEARLSPLLLELSAKRQALLEARRELDEVRAQLDDAEWTPRVTQANDAAILAVHAELTARDHLIGLEATVQRQERQIERLRTRNRELRAQLKSAVERATIARRLARKGRSLVKGERG